MPENTEGKPIPIRPGVEVLPPNVTPTQRGAEPDDPSRRNFLKKAGLVVGGFVAAIGGGTVAGRLANKYAEPSPTMPTPAENSSEDSFRREREMKARSLPTNKGPEGYTPESLKAMENIRAQQDPKPSPTPQKPK